MNDEIELPEEVLKALHRKRKIEAIKLLREERGIGLKEAKEAVDGYLATDAGVAMRSPSKTDSGIGRLVLVCFLFAVGYVVYRFLT